MKSVRIDLSGNILIGGHTKGRRKEYLGALEKIDGVIRFIPVDRFQQWAGPLGTETPDKKKLSIRVHKSVDLVAIFAGQIITDEYMLDKSSKRLYQGLLKA